MSYQSTHAHQEAQDGPSSERDRHFYLYRTLCGPAEVAPREGRVVRSRVSGQKRHTEANAVWLGISGKKTTNRRNASCFSRISRRRSQNALAKRIIFLLKSLIFKAQKNIFKKIAQVSIFSIDKLHNLAYTTIITLEGCNHPVSDQPQACFLRPSSVITPG